MARRQRIAVLAAITALTATACVNNDARPSEVRDAVEESGLDRDQAACVEQAFEEEFSQEELNSIGGVDRLDQIEPPELADRVRTILTECTSGSTGETGDEGSEGSGDEGEADQTTTTEG